MALRRVRLEIVHVDRVVVYERTLALPVAWIVGDVRMVKPDSAQEPFLGMGQLDQYRTALDERPVAAMDHVTEVDGETGALVKYSLDAMTIAVSAEAAGLLVISEVYAEGWTASVDGTSVDVLSANHAPRGAPCQWVSTWFN